MVTRKTAWVIGGASGIGKAIAASVIRSGWNVAISSRNRPRTEATASALVAVSEHSRVTAFPIDATQSEETAICAAKIIEKYGSIDALIFSAGINTPKRTWHEQAVDEFEQIIQTNLIAAGFAIHSSLPFLRKSAGTVILIGSQSAWTYNSGAGVAYGASKAGMIQLSRTLNHEEHGYGVRASCIHPGNVSTDLLLQRPQKPTDKQRREMLAPQDVADIVLYILSSNPTVRLDEVVITPISQA